MTRKSQKEEELNFANTASKLLGESWKIEAAPNEIEWPDLLVTRDGKKFGLEITQIFISEAHPGFKLQETESFRRKLLQSLAKKYYGISNVPISLKINGEFSKHIFEQLITNILYVVKESKEFEMKAFSLADGATKVHVSRLPDHFVKYSRWQYVGDSVGWVSTVPLQEIYRAIHVKEEKIEKYRKNIEDIWLLLVLDRTKNSGRAQISNSIEIKSTLFNEVYVMSYPQEILKARRGCCSEL